MSLTDAQRRAQKKYRATLKGRATKATCNKKYAESEKGKVARKRYAESEKGKVAQRKANEKYKSTRV